MKRKTSRQATKPQTKRRQTARRSSPAIAKSKVESEPVESEVESEPITARNSIDILAVMPGPQTPGFSLVTPRALQVWIALLHHSQNIGCGDRGLWNLKDLSAGCGCNENSASSALKELDLLGWINKRQNRKETGMFAGFTYELRTPAPKLTEVAADIYAQKIEAAKERIAKREHELEELAENPLPIFCDPQEEEEPDI